MLLRSLVFCLSSFYVTVLFRVVMFWFCCLFVCLFSCFLSDIIRCVRWHNQWMVKEEEKRKGRLVMKELRVFKIFLFLIGANNLLKDGIRGLIQILGNLDFKNNTFCCQCSLKTVGAIGRQMLPYLVACFSDCNIQIELLCSWSSMHL